MHASHVLLPDDNPLLDDPSRYRQTIGALQYATLSHLDIAFAVIKVCRFMHAPTKNHWAGIKRILRYLKGTINLGLWIRHNMGFRIQAFFDSHWNINHQAFSDSDWPSLTLTGLVAQSIIDPRGICYLLRLESYFMVCSQAETVSRSSTESEYKAIEDTVVGLIWLKSLFRELGLDSTSPTLWCDNLGATYLTANPVFHARTKHVEVDYHFVREQPTQGKPNVKLISTDD
ncbi:putative RNA-directed DNA polymerase [Helianthus annuus]|nr:putative RNA-directed DNA polymerase [Helianthus annuus]